MAMILALSADDESRNILNKILELGVSMIAHIEVRMSIVDGLPELGHIHLIVGFLDDADDLSLQRILALMLRQLCEHIVSLHFDRHEALIL